MKKVGKIVVVVAVMVVTYVVGYHFLNGYDGSSAKMRVLDAKVASNIPFIAEQQYPATMDSVVLPFVDSRCTGGTLSSGGHTIAYNVYLLDSPKANIVISHGFTERKEKYKEAIYYFLKMGYQVFVLDHFSHGGSGRFSSDSSLVYADNYDVFVHDLNAFITTVEQPRAKGVKTVLFGHSMGGGIAARTVEEYPAVVDGLILTAPLMKLGTPGAPPDVLADPITRLMLALGKGADYALGQGPYDPAKDQTYPPDNPGTLCVVRGKYWHDYHHRLTQHPSSGSSWQLAAALLAMGHDVVRKSNVQHITIPILLFQAEKDGYVHPDGQFTFANNASNIQFYLVKGAGHEIYLENDAIIAPYYSKLQEFINSLPMHTH